MRLNTQDLTLQRNYLQKYQFLIKEYEQIKKGEHSQFQKVKDFYLYHHTCSKSFLKYYNRYKQSGKDADLLPQRRGPKYKTRRPLPFIEEKVKVLPEKGNNRYEIVNILRPTLKQHTPSPSGVYNICKRYNLNKITKTIKTTKRKIMKERIGQLGHIDCHHLPTSIVHNNNQKLYLVCVLDDYSRIAAAELVTDVKALTVMFATLRCFNILTSEYTIRFEEVITDNGPEFGNKDHKHKEEHPFERMLLEMGIVHRYTKPYRPQTNGKVERFWRTLEDDLLAETVYDSKEALQEELLQYVYYYNHLRAHQGLNGQIPVTMISLPN